MRRGTIVLLVFVLAAVGVLVYSAVLQNQPPLEITVAVDPIAESWIRDAAAAYNATNPTVGTRRVQVTVTGVDDLTIWRDRSPWSAASHPDGWIPAGSMSVAFAQSSVIPFEIIIPSLAQTPLIWMGYRDRTDAITDGATQPLTWDAVAAISEAGTWEDGNFVYVAFPPANQNIIGLGVLLSAAGNYTESAQIDNGTLRDNGFRAWLAPVIETVNNFASIGADVAAYLTRTGSVADMAMAPESQWLNRLTSLATRREIQFSYPDYAFIFDFPYAVWQDAAAPERRQAAEAFGNWLQTAEMQRLAVEKGLRPADGVVPADAALFTAGEPYGIQIAPSYTVVITQPTDKPDVLGLIQWFTNP